MSELEAGEYWVKSRGLTGWKTCSVTVDGTFHMFGTIIQPHLIIEVGPRIPNPDEINHASESEAMASALEYGAYLCACYSDDHDNADRAAGARSVAGLMLCNADMLRSAKMDASEIRNRPKFMYRGEQR